MSNTRHLLSLVPTFDLQWDRRRIKDQMPHDAILKDGQYPYVALLYGKGIKNHEEPRHGYDVALEMELKADFPTIVVEWREQGRALAKEFVDYYCGDIK